MVAKVVNGKLKCADHVSLHHDTGWETGKWWLWFSIFRYNSIAYISCVPSDMWPLFRMLLVLFSPIIPLDGPNTMPDPTPPPYTPHTNTLSVLSADHSQSFYVTPALSCCLSVVPYTCCHLHPRCLVF